jgi:Kelch motif/Galactose oxidase, central domain
MSPTGKVRLLVAAWPVLLGACALPFGSSAPSGPPAKPTGTFGHESPMVSNAGGPALALLPDGRVLAAGGSDSRGGTADAQIYDPLHNSWSALPSMPVARGLHSATTLLDGSVLLAGGISPANDVLATASLFHPSGSWALTGAMRQPRMGHRALRLSDGRVLIIGGWSERYPGPSALPTPAIDLFDPSTRRFTGAAAAPATVQGAMFASLSDGRALMAGGEDPEHGSTSRAWLFDPKANTWTPARPMPVSRSNGFAITLANGKVLVAGGYQPQAQPAAEPPHPLSGAILYDPIQNAWSNIADAPPAIQQAFSGALLLHDGRAVAFVADFSGGPTADLSAVFYDPATGRWSTGSPISINLSGAFSPTVLQSGRVLLALDTKSLLFDPEATAPAPPQAPVHPLASPQLTPWLVLVAALFLLILAAQYTLAQVRNRRRASYR